MDGASGGAGRPRRVIGGEELRELVRVAHEPCAAVACFLLPLALVDPPTQAVASGVHAGVCRLAARDRDAAQARVVDRLFRHQDGGGGIGIDLPLRPELAEVMPPRLLQAAEEEIGSAEQQHVGTRRVPFRERREVLIDDRLVEARDDLGHRHTGLHQRVGVGLGEDAALRADLVERLTGVARAGQLLGRDLQLARGLLDEGPGAAAARRLHVDLFALAAAARREEQGLHVLPADLGDEVDVRVQRFHRRRHGDDFLHQLAADERRDEAGARPGQTDAIAPRPQTAVLFHAREEREHHLGLLRVVPLVVLPADGAVLPQHRLHRRRADVESDDHASARLPAARCRRVREIRGRTGGGAQSWHAVGGPPHRRS